MNGRPWCGREARPKVPDSAVFSTQAGRRLFIDGPGATTKYSLATPGAPLGRHVDQSHEACNKARGAYVDLHGESNATPNGIMDMLPAMGLEAVSYTHLTLPTKA